MSLDLIDNRLLPGYVQESLEVARFEVGDTDALNLASDHKFFEGFPRIMTILDVLRVLRVDTSGAWECQEH